MKRGRYSKDQQDAIKLFKGFRERSPGKILRVEIDIPDSLMIMGPVEFIGYRTTHGSRGVLYTHDFAPGSRPNLCAGPDQNQLFLIGGRYHVTERGIVDLDARGQEIDDDSERYS